MTAFRQALPLGIEAACRAAKAAYKAVVDLRADPGQAVRAALLLASGEARPYRTSIYACSCPSAWYHPGKPCKHQLRLLLEARQAELLGGTGSGTAIRTGGELG